MSDSASLLLRTPAVVPPLDPGFRPISTGSRNYLKAVRASEKRTPLAIAIERNDGLTSVHTTEVFEPGPAHQADTSGGALKHPTSRQINDTARSRCSIECA